METSTPTLGGETEWTNIQSSPYSAGIYTPNISYQHTAGTYEVPDFIDEKDAFLALVVAALEDYSSLFISGYGGISKRISILQNVRVKYPYIFSEGTRILQPIIARLSQNEIPQPAYSLEYGTIYNLPENTLPSISSDEVSRLDTIFRTLIGDYATQYNPYRWLSTDLNDRGNDVRALIMLGFEPNTPEAASAVYNNPFPLSPLQWDKLLGGGIPLCTGHMNLVVKLCYDIYTSRHIAILDLSNISTTTVTNLLKQAYINHASFRDECIASLDKVPVDLIQHLSNDIRTTTSSQIRTIYENKVKILQQVYDGILNYKEWRANVSVLPATAYLPPRETIASSSNIQQTLSYPTWDNVILSLASLGILPFKNKEEAIVAITQDAKKLLLLINQGEMVLAAGLLNYQLTGKRSQDASTLNRLLVAWSSKVTTELSWATILRITNRLGLTHVPVTLGELVILLKEKI